jgi:hypothetical protein
MIRMIATTISNSISENPLLRLIVSSERLVSAILLHFGSQSVCARGYPSWRA